MEADFTGLFGEGLMTGLGWPANLGFGGVFILSFGAGASLVSLTDRVVLGGGCWVAIGMLRNTRWKPRDTSHNGWRKDCQRMGCGMALSTGIPDSGNDEEWRGITISLDFGQEPLA